MQYECWSTSSTAQNTRDEIHNGKWLYIIFSVQWYHIGSWYRPKHKVQVLESVSGRRKWYRNNCSFQVSFGCSCGWILWPSDMLSYANWLLNFSFERTASCQCFCLFFSQWKWGGSVQSVSFHQCFSLAVIYVYILNNKKKQLGHTQLVTQSSIQMSWRCGMTSCLLVPAVHLRREYGTFMMLYDAFYGFIMEFPAAF